MVSSDRKSLTERDVLPYHENNLSRGFEVKGRISRDILNSVRRISGFTLKMDDFEHILTSRQYFDI